MVILKLKDGTVTKITDEEARKLTMSLQNPDVDFFIVGGFPIAKVMYSSMMDEATYEINNIIKSGGYICAFGWPHKRGEICGHYRVGYDENPDKRYTEMRGNDLYKLNAPREQGDSQAYLN